MAKKKTNTRVLESLKKVGAKQGFLTYDQINDYLDEDASLEEMDEIYESLGKIKVDVVDTVEEGRARLEKKKAKKKPAEAILPSQPVRFDDPVRMYLREMGRVPLLDRQGEIEIAKRIEKGQDMVLQTVFRSASSVKELSTLGQRVEKEKMNLDEFVRVDAGAFGPSNAPGKEERQAAMQRVRRIVRSHNELEKLDKIGMLDVGQGVKLLFEAVETGATQVFDGFKRKISPALGIDDLIDTSHATCAQMPDQLEAFGPLEIHG